MSIHIDRDGREWDVWIGARRWEVNLAIAWAWCSPFCWTERAGRLFDFGLSIGGPLAVYGTTGCA